MTTVAHYLDDSRIHHDGSFSLTLHHMLVLMMLPCPHHNSLFRDLICEWIGILVIAIHFPLTFGSIAACSKQFLPLLLSFTSWEALESMFSTKQNNLHIIGSCKKNLLLLLLMLLLLNIICASLEFRISLCPLFMHASTNIRHHAQLCEARESLPFERGFAPSDPHRLLNSR